ncbi:hypothetical protein I4641_20700 [Waterburya agarophytonicola K14]|uniref:HTH cro/C1-type domain-containing protein n=1 Tax=Waterburya agarophytonicola KI4 TaxID=2874699 RepID=A0A964FKS3_9CYAN|nr:hypothetical protein [Waterburya agarophytonicola]MCC0179384.1 hypothetical protein [Waterburya agarophytonicola KI4]
MNQYSYETNRQLLQDLMRQVNITDIYQLSTIAGVPRLPIIRIQRGLILNVSVGAIARIAKALNVSMDSFIETFSEQSPIAKVEPQVSENSDALAACQQEYQKLQQEMLQQQEFLEAEFQKSSLETIESWLLQWPTAVMAVHKNPSLPAARLVALVEPVEQLLKKWDVETIARVGEKIPYDPQYHQLIKGIAQIGEVVEVRYVGYKQEDKLLYKAKVSPVMS